MPILPSLCIPLVAVLAQSPQIPEPIRVTTRLVEVNVAVRDKSGPVTGLTGDDFILRDRGRVQKVVVFRPHTIRINQPSVRLPADEFTNRPQDSAEGSQEAIVIVWDRLNSYFQDAASGRVQALKALGQIQTGDRVGLYSLDADLHVIQDFTS